MDTKVDALMLPHSMKVGDRIFDRVATIGDYAEPLLKTDKANGERAYIRKMPDGTMFVTNSPRDSVYFPHGHDRALLPRYRWELQPDGAQYGYLVEAAKDA